MLRYLHSQARRLTLTVRVLHIAVFFMLFAAVAVLLLPHVPAERPDVPLLTRNAVGPAASRRRRRREPTSAAASYTRFSSDLQRDDTIDFQQVACRQNASTEGKTIEADLEFEDKAISGTKLDRDGLNAMLKAAEEGRFDTLYLYNLSRLSRESIISMPILKRLVHVFRVRVVSVTEGLDTGRDGWEMNATFLSIHHEQGLKDIAGNTSLGREFNVRAGFSAGDYRFGFASEPVPGSEKGRRGRHPRPRMKYVIDRSATVWVEKVYYWFVVQWRSIQWIVRELNRLGAPTGPRSTTKRWDHSCVVRLLRNRKYVGIWPWKETRVCRDPATGKVFQEERPAEEAEQWIRHFPELQTIDDETFAKAQQRLDENARRFAHRRDDEGRFAAGKSGDSGSSPGHLLSGLIVCASCGRAFYVGGCHGAYMFCPGKQVGSCACRTQLRRDRAERLILDIVGQRILADPEWTKAVVAFTAAAWARRQNTLPNELQDCEATLAATDRKIARLLDTLEGQDSPIPEIRQRLTERRAERRELDKRLTLLREKAANFPQEPTESWVKEQMRHLRDSLSDGTPAAALALRRLLGGQVMVEEVQRPGRKRCCLRGTITLQVSSVVRAIVGDVLSPAPSEGETEEKIIIDFLPPDRKLEQAEEVKALADQDIPNNAIGQRLHLHRSRVTLLLKYWHEVHGEERIDGRTRRGERARRQPPPRVRAIVEPVGILFDKGVPYEEMAKQLDTDRNTITEAVRYLHVLRGLNAPDGRSRRKELKSLKSGPESIPSDLPNEPASKA